MKQTTRSLGLKPIGYQLIADRGIDDDLLAGPAVKRTCATCGRILEYDLRLARISVPPRLRALDAIHTSDLHIIVSKRMTDEFIRVSSTEVRHLSIGASGFYAIVPLVELGFDLVARQAQQIGKCVGCGKYRETVGGHPGIYKISSLDPNGVYRSDVEFGSLGYSQSDVEIPRSSYLIVLGPAIADAVVALSPKGITLDEAYSSLEKSK